MAKGKGSSYERSICKKLSLWLSNGQSDDYFWRSSNSGGRATVRNRKGKGTRGHAGDVVGTHPIGERFLDSFTLELKHGYSRYSPFDLIDSMGNLNAHQYRRWIKQARSSQKIAGSRSWMIIHRRNFKKDMVYFPEKRNAAFLLSIEDFPYCILKWGKIKIVGMSLDSFMKLLDKNRSKMIWLKQEKS